jgi:hypothetical protein
MIQFLRAGLVFIILTISSCAPRGDSQLSIPSENLRAQVEQSFIEE